jgi:hypothetical protein
VSRHTPQADDPSREAELSEADLDEVAGGLQTTSGIRMDMDDEGESTPGAPKSTDAPATNETRHIQSRSGIIMSFDD